MKSSKKRSDILALVLLAFLLVSATWCVASRRLDRKHHISTRNIVVVRTGWSFVGYDLGWSPTPYLYTNVSTYSIDIDRTLLKGRNLSSVFRHGSTHRVVVAGTGSNGIVTQILD